MMSEHDQIFNLPTALNLDCKNFRLQGAQQSGIGLVASLTGIPTSTLYKKLDLNNENNSPNAEDIEKILAVTGGKNTLDALGHAAGVVWIRPADLPEFAGDMDLWAGSNAVMEKTMKLIREIEESLKDGEVDSDERVRIDRRMVELQKSAYMMLAIVKQFECGE